MFVQAQLGHSSLQMTERYIAHLNPREVVLALRNRVVPECFVEVI